jgi:hypothetical protein
VLATRAPLPGWSRHRCCCPTRSVRPMSVGETGSSPTTVPCRWFCPTTVVLRPVDTSRLQASARFQFTPTVWRRSDKSPSIPAAATRRTLRLSRARARVDRVLAVVEGFQNQIHIDAITQPLAQVPAGFAAAGARGRSDSWSPFLQAVVGHRALQFQARGAACPARACSDSRPWRGHVH